MIICTHCDIGYLGKALALHYSLRQTLGDNFVLCWLCDDDEIMFKVLEMNLPCVEVFSLSYLEGVDPELAAAKNNPPSKYGDSLSQYRWATTPYFINHILKHFVPEGEVLMYADADEYFYHSPKIILDTMGNRSLAIQTHRFGGPYNENIIAGWYNMGVYAVRNDETGRKWSEMFKDWLISTTHRYYRKYGTCGEQKYLELAHQMCGDDNVCVFDNEWPQNYSHYAPWCADGLEGKDIVFGHFSHFSMDEKGWKDSHNGEWSPAKDPVIAEMYQDYYETISVLL